MQEVLSNEEFENVDLSKIAALQQKRTLAFVNHFVITTVQFLNTFSRSCEKKLMQFEAKLEKVDAAMVLLEARLSSIPEVNNESVTVDEPQKDSQNKSIDQKEDTPDTSIEVEDKTQEASSTKSNDTVQIKPEYERFVKMVQVGVPLEAVKLKASLEGLDPIELEKMLKK
ncbi:WASH complex subunit 3 [Battus philenor]|uniref:WASH complex subunit 3 n=1 Tax=Battus philenor TaxID=42288 RepID=UPI0035CFB58A